MFVFASLVVPTALEAGRYIVRFKSQNNTNSFFQGVSKKLALSRLATKIQGNSLIRTQSLKNINVMIAEGNLEDIQRDIASDANVAFVEEDKNIELAEAANDASNLDTAPYMKDVLGLNSQSPSSTESYSGSNPILVAVIDSGSNMNHPFLASAKSINSNEISGNNRDNDGNGYKNDVNGTGVVATNAVYDSDSKTYYCADSNNASAADVYGHGTHVAGLVKAIRDQAIAYTDIHGGNPYDDARRVQILPIRFFCKTPGGGITGSTSGALRALDYALSRNVKVVNMSWGGGEESYSQALYETLVDLYNNNIVLVAAAGNSYQNTDISPFVPAALNTAIPGLISVGSITASYDDAGDMSDLSLSYFSNYGRRSVDVSAPGSMYLPSYDPNYVGLVSSNSDYLTDGYNFLQMQGTSMAAPVVAGVAAVVRSLNASLNAYDVKSLILSEAIEIPSLINKNRVNGHVDAAKTFKSALTASSHGSLPATSSPNFSAASESTSSASSKVGGCGAVMSSASGGDNNPFGGNSLGLLTTCYFLVQIAKRMRYKLSQ